MCLTDDKVRVEKRGGVVGRLGVSLTDSESLPSLTIGVSESDAKTLTPRDLMQWAIGRSSIT